MEITVIQTFPYDALSPHTREDHPGGFDQRTGQPIPGFRGEDQLLVYDESYGQKSTGTNYWGVELLVDRDGTILRAAGGDSPIPEGGLVISGNGRWSRPLTEVDPFGVRVTLDREHKEVRLETSPALLRAAAENGDLQNITGSQNNAAASQLNRVLSDPEAAKKLLSTPAAQKLFEALGGKK